MAQFCVKWSLRMIVQSAIFSRISVVQYKQKFSLSFAKIVQKFCKWIPYSISWISIPCIFRDLYFSTPACFPAARLFSLSFLILEGFFCFPSRGTWGLGEEKKVEPWGLVGDEKVIFSFSILSLQKHASPDICWTTLII